MQKFIIKNRYGLKIVGNVLVNSDSKGVVFVAHGLGGHRKQLHIQTISETFFDLGYTVITWDSTHSLGESECNYAFATSTIYYENLEDVINRASTQDYYKEPFILAGHSVGGLVSVIYAKNNIGKVKALLPISSVISGVLFKEMLGSDILGMRERQGYWDGLIGTDNNNKPNLNWTFIEDLMKYDISKNADLITIPIGLIIGDKDGGVPIKHQKIFFDNLPINDKNKFYILSDTGHSIKSSHQLNQLKEYITNFIINSH